MPLQVAQLLQIRQATVPTVKSYQFGLKTAFSRFLQHISKMIIFAQTILSLVVEAKITRQSTTFVAPYQRDQVDPLHYPPMLTRPVARHQCHLRSIRLVQRGVINDQNAYLSPNQWLNFLPQTFTIRWQSLQQSRVGRRALALLPPTDGFARLQHC